MRKLIKTALVVVMALCAVNVSAQKKLGHIDSDSLMKMMPGYDSAVIKIQKEVAVYKDQITVMQTEYDKKLEEYKAGLATMSDLVKQTKAGELEDISARIEKFTASAQTAIQAKQAELVKPLIDKAKKAIEDVAKENGFAYIFDNAGANGTVLLYTAGGEDIMNLVKKKIGIK